ncbi:MAG TPA: hypothetical protein P5528_15885 [Steroidobacteraceae bacterium]|nr:hypothetical protein [Steroidobacteraceae bacterium]
MNISQGYKALVTSCSLALTTISSSMELQQGYLLLVGPAPDFNISKVEIDLMGQRIFLSTNARKSLEILPRGIQIAIYGYCSDTANAIATRVERVGDYFVAGSTYAYVRGTVTRREDDTGKLMIGKLTVDITALTIRDKVRSAMVGSEIEIAGHLYTESAFSALELASPSTTYGNYCIGGESVSAQGIAGTGRTDAQGIAGTERTNAQGIAGTGRTDAQGIAGTGRTDAQGIAGTGRTDAQGIAGTGRTDAQGIAGTGRTDAQGIAGRAEFIASPKSSGLAQ